MTIEEYSKEWVARRSWAPSTVDKVDVDLRLHIIPHLGGRPLTSLRRPHGEDWATGLSLAPRTVAEVFQTLATIVEHVPVGIIVVDREGRLLLMNEAGRRISGESPGPADAVSHQAGDYAIREPKTGRPLAPEETPIARSLAGEVVENFEYVFRPVGAAARFDAAGALAGSTFFLPIRPR